MYRIIDPDTYTQKRITTDLFGLNFVLTYDMEFHDVGPLTDVLATLQPESLRYPGGSITEMMFADIEYGSENWSEMYFNSVQNGLTQRENALLFVDAAAAVGASIQLVLPTKIAFEQTPGQAIFNGTYGERREIHSEYFSLITDYINEFITLTEGKSTEISRIEIGNEFWGSGQMTASEYGYLAAAVTQFLTTEFPSYDVIAQVTYNAGVFSPVEDTIMYLTEGGTDYDMHFAFQDLSDIEGLIEYTMPGQGSGVGQTQAIAREFRENPVALAALDGIVDHVYFRRGFSGIDGERDHALRAIPQTFKDSSGSGPIDAYITEWSVRNRAGDRKSETTNHTGLQYASSTLEAFYEMVANEVHGANFWPLTYGNESIDRRVLIDTTEQDLTFGGEIFRLLSNNLPGLAPVFDFEVADQMDIHGFGNEDNLVFFVSERSGSANRVQVDFLEYATSDSFFYTIEYIGEDGDTGIAINSNPVITEVGGYSTEITVVDLDLPAWSLAMVNVQNITDGDDEVLGTNLSDHIYGNGGDDILLGYSGNDILRGNLGNDTLSGGDGDDDIKGGWGDDAIFGGSGNDTLKGNFGNNSLSAGAGDDKVIGSTGNNFVLAGSGNDYVEVFSGANFVDAGTGDDKIYLPSTGVFWGADMFAFNAGSVSQDGAGQIVNIAGLQRNSSTFHGGAGSDTLHLSDQSDALFLDDQLSQTHSSLSSRASVGALFNTPRLTSIESIQAGMGDDIVDLTSRRFSLSNDSIIIDGGQGSDTIWGSDANETIYGGDGNDYLFGGAGSNLLSGGNGADTFQFLILETNDVIKDFNLSEGDRIQVFGAKDASEISFNWTEGELDINFYFGSGIQNFKVLVEFEGSGYNIESNSEVWEDFIIFG